MISVNKLYCRNLIRFKTGFINLTKSNVFKLWSAHNDILDYVTNNWSTDNCLVLLRCSNLFKTTISIHVR